MPFNLNPTPPPAQSGQSSKQLPVFQSYSFSKAMFYAFNGPFLILIILLPFLLTVLSLILNKNNGQVLGLDLSALIPSTTFLSTKTPNIFFVSIVIILVIKVINKSLDVDQMANINIKNSPYSGTGFTLNKLTYPVFQKSNPIANFVSFKFFGPSNFPSYFILKNNPEIISRLENILSGYCGLKNMTGKTIDAAALQPPAAGSQISSPSSFTPPTTASKDESSDNPARQVSNGIGRAISAFVILMVVGNTVYGIFRNFQISAINKDYNYSVPYQTPAKQTGKQSIAPAAIDYTYYSSQVIHPMIKVTPLEAKEDNTVIDDYTKSKVLVEFAMPKDHSMKYTVYYDFIVSMNMNKGYTVDMAKLKQLDFINLQPFNLDTNPNVSEIRKHPDGTVSFVYNLPHFAGEINKAAPESLNFNLRWHSDSPEYPGSVGLQWELKIKK